MWYFVNGGSALHSAEFTSPKTQKNIDLARAKSEALDNIYSLFKERIKSCNAKRRRHATTANGEKQQ